MAFRRQDVIIASIAVLIAGGAFSWIPLIRWVASAFVTGLTIPVLIIGGLILLVSRGSRHGQKAGRRRPVGPALLKSSAWRSEVRALHQRQLYHKRPLYPSVPIVSQALDDLLECILRDFVNSWYSNISKNAVFVNEIDKTVRLALEGLRDRLLDVDLADVVTTRFVPILTAHFKDFYDAERAVRGKSLSRNVTESEELDLAIASRYNEGKLHAAASLAYSGTKGVQQAYLRNLTGKLLPHLLPESNIGSRAVGVLIKELTACAVLTPIMQLFADPDTWNQLMESYGRTMLQDRSTVRKLRAALDEHTSPVPTSKRAIQFPRLSPGDKERKFEKFIRAIRKVNNLSDARRFRSEVASQLRKDVLRDTQDSTYLRRLDISKRILDQRVKQLAGGESVASVSRQTMKHGINEASKLENASLVDLLHDPSGLSYFMEFMDRQRLMPLVQFWLVVDGFRNPLEDAFAQDDEIPTTLPTWSQADRADLAQINEVYLPKPELRVPEKSRQLVRDFLKAGKDASPEQFFLARKAILRAQTNILELMQERYFDDFKKSDLFYKCLTSQEATKPLTLVASPTMLNTVSIKPPLPPRAKTMQSPIAIPAPSSYAPANLSSRNADLRRTNTSSSDLASPVNIHKDDEAPTRRSIDSSSRLHFSEDEDIDSEGMNGSLHSLDTESINQGPDHNVVQAMEAALNDIMEDKPNDDDLRRSLFGSENDVGTLNSSTTSPAGNTSSTSLESKSADLFRRETEKPSISSLGLVNTSSRIGVFTDDDLFPDEAKFMSDEHEDPEEEAQNTPSDDEVHTAAPGDLGLVEAITVLAADIDRLHAQDAVIDTLTRKAELTNNTAELRILRKSKASLCRELRRKELQREQYMVQESDNGLYGRSIISIKSILVGKDTDGSEYAIYVVEVQRKAGEQMPAATWTINRRYSEFHQLHQRLRVRYVSVRGLDFPRRRMVMKFQSEFLQKRRLALEKYLKNLLLLPEVCRSREFRAFLSQKAMKQLDDGSYDNEDKQDMMTRLYNSITDGMEDILGSIPVLDQLSVAGQNLLSAATSQLLTMPTTVNQDPASAAEAEAELNAFEDRELEPFVKPICDIFLEVFELNRGNNWLRGRAVVVVLHQLLGGTIERKVRENVKGLVQNEAVLRYINLLKNVMWPGGQLKRDITPRFSSEKTKSRTEASLMLATLVPDLAGSVVGRVNAQAASRRIFATFNNPRLNTHLAYTFLDEIVKVLFGEL